MGVGVMEYLFLRLLEICLVFFFCYFFFGIFDSITSFSLVFIFRLNIFQFIIALQAFSCILTFNILLEGENNGILRRTELKNKLHIVLQFLCASMKMTE